MEMSMELQGTKATVKEQQQIRPRQQIFRHEAGGGGDKITIFVFFFLILLLNAMIDRSFSEFRSADFSVLKVRKSLMMSSTRFRVGPLKFVFLLNLLISLPFKKQH